CSVPQEALQLPDLETLAAYRTYRPGLSQHMVLPLEWADTCPEKVLLRHRTLGHLPEQLCAHPDLRVLDLTGSRSWAPDSLWANDTLTSLRIDLDEIPHDGSGWGGKGRDPEGLQGLSELQLGGRFKTLPGWIFKLSDLERLTLRGVGIQALPDEIGTMKYLRVLDLGEASGLKTLPDTLMDCRGLKMVRLVGQVQEGRRESRFRSLRWDSLPRAIMEHPTLKTLTLDGALAERVRADLDALEERGVEVFIFPEPHRWLDFFHLMVLDTDPLSDVFRWAREELRDWIEEAVQAR
ncbi:MAG: hypothetical protein VX938_11135, partial [Myxococcota bacterium]|nr:hypothetical protein [Myxococcota bacterium]